MLLTLGRFAAFNRLVPSAAYKHAAIARCLYFGLFAALRARVRVFFYRVHSIDHPFLFLLALSRAEFGWREVRELQLDAKF